MNKLFISLLAATALFILAYWTSVFTELFPVVELVPGYRNWFMSFPVPDFYIAAAAVATIYNFQKNKKVASIFSAMTGSGLLFLGLYAFSYGFNSGLIYNLNTEEIIEIAIKVYCLAVGTFFIAVAWRQMKA